MFRNISRMIKYEFGNEIKYYRWKIILYILINMVCKIKIDINIIFVIIMYVFFIIANLYILYIGNYWF